jgi:glycosyltransferase involved in cell wall biosynthesis
MIYLDVTDSCKSPLNTGIQRVVRGFFRGLCEAQIAVTPILWEPALDAYCALSQQEHNFLVAPFSGAGGRKALEQPSRTFFPTWTRFVRRMVHRRNRLDLSSLLKKSDTLIVPQVFRDERGGFTRRLGARRIAFFYDAIPWRRPEITPPTNVAGVVEYMMALAEFDMVITSSREAMDDLRACWELHKAAKAPPLHVHPWPLDECFFAPQASSAVQTHSRKRILCIGTLEPRKNHLTLLAAAEQLWNERLDFELELIGRTTRECGPRVLAEVERLRKAGRTVQWRRHVDNESLLAAYEACAFTVFPSLAEGYGLPLAESLARGKPCVCGGNGALGEVAQDGGCLIVDQTNAADIAKKMRILLADDAFYQKLCADARARTFENWSSFIVKALRNLNASTST